MLTDQEEQAEKRRTLLNDVRAREQARQGTTYKAFADADAEIPGRFQSVAAARVIGSVPSPSSQYPAASAAHQTELPPEPSLGFSIDEMPGLESSMATSSSSVEATGDPADAPSSDDGGSATSSGGLMSERAGSSSSNKRSE